MVFLLYSISTAVYAAIWPYFTAERFSWSPAMIGLSLTVYGVCFAFIQGVLVQPTINLIGRYNTVLLGFGVEIVAMVLIAIITNGWFLIALTHSSGYANIFFSISHFTYSRLDYTRSC